MPSDRSPLDAESALLAYVLLLVGMYAIGAPAQASGVVYGLWLTELVAIALPAIFRISLAGVRIAPYLGLRRLTWKQALIAAGVATANQPVISFVTWLARLTRNLLIDHYRRTRQERVTDSIEEQLPMMEENVAASARPDGLVAGREASEILQIALQKLSPELRETVILRDLQEMEYREIAQVLKVPEGTVKSRLNRVRAELARVLRKQKLVV